MTTREPDSVLFSHGQVFTGAWARRLSETVLEQGGDMLKAAGARIDPLCVSTLLQIEKDGQATIADIARQLGLSHQLVRQRTTKLEKAGLIEAAPSVKDGRKRELRLRPEAADEIRKILAVMAQVDKAMQNLTEELGIALMPHLQAATNALRARPLIART